jgi:phosphoglycolate phosphatase-like HAD superfamily hydrolase
LLTRDGELRLVMFDLDGTLADTGHDLADSVSARAEFSLPPLRKCVTRTLGAASASAQHSLEEGRQFPKSSGVSVTTKPHLLDRTVLYPEWRILRYFT